MAAFWVIDNQFQKFIDWQDFVDYDSQMTEKFFAKYTRTKVTQFRETLLQHMGNVKKSVAVKVRHQRQYERRVNNRQMQTQESKIDSGSALDVVSSQALYADLVVMESNGTESGMHDTSSSSENYITHVMDANIRLVNNQVPLAEDSPEFRDFFEINELKAQLQAKNSTINNLKKQIKHVHVKSNEAKVKHDIDVLETINIELESSVAKLLAENEKLNKENEHLKQTYKELYDSIKMTRIQTKDHNNSLISQVHSKTVKNADLKAQIQEKVFANATLKNKLRKLKGTCVDTKFAKPSILGKPVLQPHRNQSVIRQPTAFKYERFQASILNVNKMTSVLISSGLALHRQMTSVHISLGLALQRQMASADNTSGPVPQRKERCMLQCALSSKEEKSSCFRPFSSTSFKFSHARLVQNSVSPTTYVPPSKRDYKILFQPLFDEYFNPPPCAVSPDPVVVHAPRPVDLAGSPLSTTIDQDVPSASTSPINQEIQFQVTHQGVEEQIHGHQNA
ncbi:hypothetical protein Tco_1072742 [Tanacetum coccineum]